MLSRRSASHAQTLRRNASARPCCLLSLQVNDYPTRVQIKGARGLRSPCATALFQSKSPCQRQEIKRKKVIVHTQSTKVSSPQTPRVSSMAKQEIRPRKHEGPREGGSAGLRVVAIARRGEASPPSKTRREEVLQDFGHVRGSGARLIASFPCLGCSLGPADKSYNRLTNSSAQGS